MIKKIWKVTYGGAWDTTEAIVMAYCPASAIKLGVGALEKNPINPEVECLGLYNCVEENVEPHIIMKAHSWNINNV